MESSRREQDLRRILEASLQELYSLRGEKTFSSEHSAYLEVLIAYLSADQESLRQWSEKLSGVPILGDLAALRLQIRARSVRPGLLSKLADELRKTNEAPDEETRWASALWRAESTFLLARAEEVMDRHGRAMDLYLNAHTLFRSAGCPRKSVKSFQNHVAAKSRIHLGLNFIDEYREIIRLARVAQEYGIAGVAAMNISRELEASGAPRAALKYANRALMLMTRDAGSLHFFLAIIHRCHLLLVLGRTEAARLDLETAMLSAHQEIMAAVQCLEPRFSGEKKPNSGVIGFFKNLTVGWRARFPGIERPTLAEQEDRLIELLSSGPKSRQRLNQAIWGERIDSEVVSLRFKSLLNRVRKKRDGLVIFDGRNYGLSERSFTNSTET